MQSMIAKCASSFLMIVAILILSPSASALEVNSGVIVTPLMKTDSTWEGRQIVYPKGKAEITALRVDIAPGAETGWHWHTVPSFAVMLEGTLEVSLKDGRVKILHAGDVLAEVVDTPHIGRNVGNIPVRLVVFYAGVKGRVDTVKGKRDAGKHP